MAPARRIFGNSTKHLFMKIPPAVGPGGRSHDKKHLLQFAKIKFK